MQFHFETADKILDKTSIVFVEDLSLKNLIKGNKPKTDSEGNYVANGQALSLVEVRHETLLLLLGSPVCTTYNLCEF